MNRAQVRWHHIENGNAFVSRRGRDESRPYTDDSVYVSGFSSSFWPFG
jgi:hypothetical protein